MAITTAQAPLGNFSTGAGTTIAKALGSNLTAGNTLAVAFLWGSSTQTGSVSGSVNGALTAVAGSLATNASGPFRIEWFIKTNITAGADTITGTSSGSNSQREIVVFELATVATAGQPDSSNGASGSSTNPTSTITTVAQPGMILAYAAATAGTITVGSGYTSAVSQNGDLAQYKTYTATGSTSVPTVDGSVSQWALSMVALLEATGGGGGVTVKQLAALGVG